MIIVEQEFNTQEERAVLGIGRILVSRNDITAVLKNKFGDPRHDPPLVSALK
jgi:hypothetical protein